MKAKQIKLEKQLDSAPPFKASPPAATRAELREQRVGDAAQTYDTASDTLRTPSPKAGGGENTVQELRSMVQKRQEERRIKDELRLASLVEVIPSSYVADNGYYHVRRERFFF